MNRTVYHRDASSLRSPGCATRYHLPRDADCTFALCSEQILLDESNACDELEAGPLMCKRCEKMVMEQRSVGEVIRFDRDVAPPPQSRGGYWWATGRYTFCSAIAVFAPLGRRRSKPILRWRWPADSCEWVRGNKPCQSCPRSISALHRCKLLQDELGQQESLDAS